MSALYDAAVVLCWFIQSFISGVAINIISYAQRVKLLQRLSKNQPE